jgi:hypothetical protein
LKSENENLSGGGNNSEKENHIKNEEHATASNATSNETVDANNNNNNDTTNNDNTTTTANDDENDPFFRSIRERVEKIYGQFYREHGDSVEEEGSKTQQEMEKRAFVEQIKTRKAEILKRKDSLKGVLVSERRKS